MSLDRRYGHTRSGAVGGLGGHRIERDGSEAQAARRWYRNLPQCRAALKGQDCDEYPFYSTMQGGPARDGFPAGDIKPINPTDNRAQGAALNGFYQGCRVSSGVSFFVLPMDNPIVPTFGYCIAP